MGNIHRLKKQIAGQQIAMADTKLEFNGCRVYLGHPNPSRAGQSAAAFTNFFATAVHRSRMPNVSDMYDAQFKVREAVESKSLGEFIGN